MNHQVKIGKSREKTSFKVLLTKHSDRESKCKSSGNAPARIDLQAGVDFLESSLNIIGDVDGLASKGQAAIWNRE